MTSARTRLRNLEGRHREQGPQLHDDCLELFSARLWTTPDDQTPTLECFHGDADACPYQSWAAYQRRNREGLLEIAYGFTDDPELNPPADYGGAAPAAESSTSKHYAHHLPRLEAKLASVRGQTTDS